MFGLCTNKHMKGTHSSNKFEEVIFSKQNEQKEEEENKAKRRKISMMAFTNRTPRTKCG